MLILVQSLSIKSSLSDELRLDFGCKHGKRGRTKGFIADLEANGDKDGKNDEHNE